MLANTVPSWLATMRKIDGTLEEPGSADNPVILSWSDAIAQAFPDMANYASKYKHDETKWCGLTVAYCMAVNGIRPPHDPSDELKSYLWVDAWANWGAAVPAGQEQPGDVLVFSSPHHVTLYEDEDDGHYLGHGGNQDDRVKTSRYAKSGIKVIRRPPSPASKGEMPSKLVPAGSSSGRFHSLIGGSYSSTPMDKASGPVAIRMNNPGAINGAAWLRSYPGYVSEVETTPGNRSTIFETPEHGVAVWYELMKKYRAAGATTVRGIINRYGGGQDYSGYIADIVARTGLSQDHEVALEGDDATLLKFAKAMFRHEAGRDTPLSDEQILYGFKFAREYARTGQPPAQAKPVEIPTRWREPPIEREDMQPKRGDRLPLLIFVLMMLARQKRGADAEKSWQGLDIEEMVLPLLLRSALTGTQIDIEDLLSAVLTGKPGAAVPYMPSSPPAAPQEPINIDTLLQRLIYERLAGKPWPGTTPAESQTKPDAPDTQAQPAISRPSVQLSAGALGISTILQALGVVGMPFGLGGEAATQTGTMATLIPIITGAIGATGGFGGLLDIGRRLLGGLGRRTT